MGRKEGEDQAVGVLSKYLNFPPTLLRLTVIKVEVGTIYNYGVRVRLPSTGHCRESRGR